MPQSKHRKTTKAKKRPRGPYSPAKTPSTTGGGRQARIIAIVVVLALAASAIAYLFMQRGRSGGGGGSEVTTATGLKYVDITEGTGPSPQTGQNISVNYTGMLENGTKFDSSFDHGKPYEFRIGTGRVIKGWDEGILTMKVGGKRRLIIPANLGYGARGNPPNIPTNATLLFDVELLGIK